MFASDDQNTWTAISLDRTPTIYECMQTEMEVSVRPEILLHEEQFEEWCDSSPHKSEVVQYCKLEAEN